ncbi:MAG: methyltransferase domain-containing protein [Candidatus Marinimicrobia bacterium]|nr:methyltransferase domain-containing protein [Candidatus Neomarinimicrobiota bacterium]MCF7827372.1 methyltransferase domain-containing protein [Candidatus Neomarinimicrobiota bacterium]MCF7881395.1 methyltransferase domain-containing protein [Candidatus Neomarinimicrobiota bacterium]
MTEVETYSETVETARDYYNSDDADNFYYTIWGGEDIHIGLYKSEDESISDASQRTVKRMAAMAGKLDEDTRVLDLGAGYGGAARYLADTFGCDVVALNLSEVENERNRDKNVMAGLADQIKVVDGNFEDVPEPDNSFDLVWSQDSFLHSGNRDQVLAEAARVLKPGGDLIFTDPMQADDCPDGVLEPILERIHLESLGSPRFYREQAEKLGMEEQAFDEQTENLINHYTRVLEETESHEKELRESVSQDYIDHMKAGLQHWIDGGKKGYLSWGIFHFTK